jgi:hypothetical protein
MPQAITPPTTSRRRFLSLLGLAGAATVTTTTAVAISAKSKPEKSDGPFKHPSEYLAAMHAIGWQPVAMYHRKRDGSIVRMGVDEGANEDNVMASWKEYHAISMRMPPQLPCDAHPHGWWEEVWHYLYDKGLREDVTPRSYISS